MAKSDDLTRQQLCAALSVSESTIRRLELLGLPYTPVGLRAKRYNLAECKQWLRENLHHLRRPDVKPFAIGSAAGLAFSQAARKIKLRTLPSA